MSSVSVGRSTLCSARTSRRAEMKSNREYRAPGGGSTHWHRDSCGH